MVFCAYFPPLLSQFSITGFMPLTRSACRHLRWVCAGNQFRNYCWWEEVWRTWMRTRCQCAFQQPITWVGLSRSTSDKWANNWNRCVLLKYGYWRKELRKVCFIQQNPEDLINRKRDIGVQTKMAPMGRSANRMNLRERGEPSKKGWYNPCTLESVGCARLGNLDFFEIFFTGCWGWTWVLTRVFLSSHSEWFTAWDFHW